jgi:hypothetical protein
MISTCTDGAILSSEILAIALSRLSGQYSTEYWKQ